MLGETATYNACTCICRAPARICMLLILPCSIPVTVCRQLTACLQAGLSAVLGDRPLQWESGIWVICCEDQICLTYFGFAQRYLGLALTAALRCYLRSNLRFIQISGGGALLTWATYERGVLAGTRPLSSGNWCGVVWCGALCVLT